MSMGAITEDHFNAWLICLVCYLCCLCCGCVMDGLCALRFNGHILEYKSFLPCSALSCYLHFITRV